MNLDAEARAALEPLAAALREIAPDAVASPTLAEGAAGLALTHLALTPLLPEHGPLAGEAIQRAVALAGGGEIHLGLWTGLAGVGWTIQQFAPPDEDPNADIDAMLLDVVQAWPEDGNLDVISGLSGVAVYAAERTPRDSAAELLAACADVVARRAIAVPGGVTWLVDQTYNDYQESQGRGGMPYNLGVSHGAPGPLSVLALARAWGVADHAELLDGGLSWLCARKTANDTFPGAADEAGRHQGGRRHGWCFGGVGVGAWLLAMARLLGRPALAEVGGALLAAVGPTDPTDVTDAWLCHGDAGVALLYGGAARALPALRPVAEPWTARLIQRAWRQDWGTGHRTNEALPPTFALLEGTQGVLAALAAEAGSDVVPWGRLLLTDLRGPGDVR